MICKICNKDFDYKSGCFTKHLKSSHKLTNQDYYDIYFKKENENKCLTCGKETPFLSISKGYQKHCSATCSNSDLNVQNKMKKTWAKNYGKDIINPSQVKEIKLKKEQTTFQHYGVKNPAQSKEVRDKMQQTSFERYGYRAYNHKKGEETMLIRYGVNSPMKSKVFLDKAIQTCYNHFGVNYPQQSKEVQAKSKQTCITKYGVETNLQVLEVRQKCRKHYLYDNVFFDSSWELAFYIWFKDANITILREPIRLKYLDKHGKSHYYYPDFQLEDDRFEDNHVLIEIKGDHMLNDQMQLIDPKTKEIDYEKTQCMIDNHVYIMTFKDCEPFIKYCQEKFNDKKWYKQFIYHKDKGEQENNE